MESCLLRLASDPSKIGQLIIVFYDTEGNASMRRFGRDPFNVLSAYGLAKYLSLGLEKSIEDLVSTPEDFSEPGLPPTDED